MSTMLIMAARFSEFLRNELDRRHRNQNWLAKELDIAHGSVSHWYHGKRVPSPRSCRRIAAVLDLDPDVVLHAAGHRAPPTPLAEESPGGKLTALVRAIDWLRDPAVYELVAGMLEGIVETQNAQDKVRSISMKKVNGGQRRTKVVNGNSDPIGK
jgi:transcriptional regulator with XRE-family HTH domain